MCKNYNTHLTVAGSRRTASKSPKVYPGHASVNEEEKTKIKIFLCKFLNNYSGDNLSLPYYCVTVIYHRRNICMLVSMNTLFLKCCC